jgi:hypothetical protein
MERRKNPTSNQMERFLLCLPRPMSSRILLLFVIFALLPKVHGLQIGDTREQIVTQYGNPSEGDLNVEGGHGIYRWNAWRLDIEVGHGIAQRLVFTREPSPINEAEVRQLLNENGGLASWQSVDHVALDSLADKKWRRISDGAEAFTSRESPRAMVLVTKAWVDAHAREPISVARNVRPKVTTPTPSNRHPRETLDPLASILVGLVLLMGFAVFVGFIAWLVRSSWRKPPAPLSPADGGLWSPPPLPEELDSDREALIPSPVGIPNSNFPRRKSLGDLSWQEFELLIGELYRRQGHTVEICSGDGSDGGVDLRLSRDGKTALVQCKHWKVYKVGVAAVRELFGILSAERADRAIFVTTGRFTSDARSFAEGKPMELTDGEKLHALLEEAKYSGQGDLLDVESWSKEFARSATIVAPMCPFCRSRMVLRHGKQSGNAFWGSSTYPRCRGKRNVRAELMGS